MGCCGQAHIYSTHFSLVPCGVILKSHASENLWMSHLSAPTALFPRTHRCLFWTHCLFLGFPKWSVQQLYIFPVHLLFWTTRSGFQYVWDVYYMQYMQVYGIQIHDCSILMSGICEAETRLYCQCSQDLTSVLHLRASRTAPRRQSHCLFSPVCASVPAFLITEALFSQSPSVQQTEQTRFLLVLASLD